MVLKILSEILKRLVLLSYQKLRELFFKLFTIKNLRESCLRESTATKAISGVELMAT